MLPFPSLLTGVPRRRLVISEGAFLLTELTGQTGHLEELTLQRLEHDIYSSGRMRGIIVQVFLQIVVFSFQTDGSGRPVLTKVESFSHFVRNREILKPGATCSSQTHGRMIRTKWRREGKKNTNRTYLLLILFEAFQSTAKEGAMCD